MTTCVQADANNTLQVVIPQPADLTTCQFLIFTPAEVPAVTQTLDAVAASGFFAFGLTMVLASYWVSFAVGTVLKVVRSAGS